VRSRLISPALRSPNWERAEGRCEYCGLYEGNSLVPQQPDHIVAVQHGGETNLENLALSCDCNLLKGPNLASIDPKTGGREFLFNPRRDRWFDHFRVEGGFISGLTPIGRATAFLLQFNNSDRVRLRLVLDRIR